MSDQISAQLASGIEPELGASPVRHRINTRKSASRHSFLWQASKVSSFPAFRHTGRTPESDRPEDQSGTRISIN